VEFLRQTSVMMAMFAAALLLLTSVASADGLDESRKKLEEIESRITQTAKNLEAKRSAEPSLGEDLQAVEGELALLQAKVAARKRALAGLDGEIASKGEAVDGARRAIAVTEKDVRRRLAALYKNGEAGMVKILFSSSTPAQMAEDYDFFGRIVRRDRELLATYRRQAEELQAALARLADLRRQQQSSLADLGEEEKTTRRALRLKEEILVQVRRDRQALAAALTELRERASRLADLVKKLESDKTREYTEKPTLFSALKGRLSWPVDGVVRIGFGTARHPELGTMHDSQGIEIATTGTPPIKAVAAGRVIFANWFKGYGNLLIVDHGDSYYSLYAQAARLAKKVGEPVAAGETVGQSGLEGAAGVYFEIRRGGVPLDPGDWLRPR